MAITTLAGVISGLKPTLVTVKDGGGAANGSGQYVTNWYGAGFPVAATANTSGLSGAALTANVTGQYPFNNPTSGNTYLASTRMCLDNAPFSTAISSKMFVDRLWHNSGIDATSTSAQTINSVTWPARDVDGSTNGKGVYIALEVSSTMGNAYPSVTLSYTNSDGTSGRTASNALGGRVNAPVGMIFPFELQAGDVGVRSIQSITFGASWLSGTIHLIAYRPIVMFGLDLASYRSVSDDALTMAMPRLFDNTVLQLFSFANTNGSTGNGKLTLTYTQG